MQLVIDNVDSLEEVVVKASDGTTYYFVKSEEYKSVIRELDKLRKTSDYDFIKQADLIKEQGIGHRKLQEWVADGLPKYIVGGNVYYRLSEIANYKAKHKI